MNVNRAAELKPLPGVRWSVVLAVLRLIQNSRPLSFKCFEQPARRTRIVSLVRWRRPKTLTVGHSAQLNDMLKCSNPITVCDLRIKTMRPQALSNAIENLLSML
jgi:hypothetical protein